MKTILRWLACLMISVLFFVSLAPVAYAGVPPLPHTFYGTVKINGANASTGTVIAAKVGGVECGSYTTTEAGNYGSPAEGNYLVVSGDIHDGDTINFYVNSVDTNQTTSFIPGGGPTELNLTVTISAPSGGGVGGGGGAPPAGPTTIAASLFGESVEFSIDNEGVIQETIEATSKDGNLTITIPEDTIALDKDGDPLDSLETAIDESPPSPPEGADIIGLAYDFGPDGATFDPPITVEYTYDPADIPEGVAEEDLVVAYYDEEAGEWVECECTCDPEIHCITACVCHFTTFAIIGTVTPPPPLAPATFSLSNLSIQPAEVQPKEAVTITVLVANTGGIEGSYSVVLKISSVKEAEKSVTIPAGESQVVSFSVAKEDAGTYSVVVDGLTGSFTVVAPPPPPPAPPAPPAKPPINWPMIGAIIVATIVVGLLIFFLIRRRAA